MGVKIRTAASLVNSVPVNVPAKKRYVNSFTPSPPAALAMRHARNRKNPACSAMSVMIMRLTIVMTGSARKVSDARTAARGRRPAAMVSRAPRMAAPAGWIRKGPMAGRASESPIVRARTETAAAWPTLDSLLSYSAWTASLSASSSVRPIRAFPRKTTSTRLSWVTGFCCDRRKSGST